MDECRAIVDKINTEMATLKSMQDEDSEILQSFYLETLNLNATLQKGNQLKESRARIKAAEEKAAAKGATVITKEPDLSPKYPIIPRETQKSEPIATFRLEVTAPASKLKALRQYIDANGISYRKI